MGTGTRTTSILLLLASRVPVERHKMCLVIYKLVPISSLKSAERQHPLRRGDRPRVLDALTGELTLVQVLGGKRRRFGLGHLGGGLGQVDLNVAGVAFVRVDTAVGTVGAAVGLGGLLDDDVADEELFGVQSLAFSVGLGVL